MDQEQGQGKRNWEEVWLFWKDPIVAVLAARIIVWIVATRASLDGNPMEPELINRNYELANIAGLWVGGGFQMVLHLARAIGRAVVDRRYSGDQN